MTPTPAGEGKTTVAIGLADGLRRLGARTAVCLRQPSMGPVFGRKGGGTGAGHARLQPEDRINLHFTGDMHAVAAAQNLLAAAVDNHLHFGNALDLDVGRLFVRRALDMNDRSLRQVMIGLGPNGPSREEHFEITAAGEVMAVLSLAEDYASLKARLARIVVGLDRAGRPVTAGALRASGAMAALLQEALMPNLVQTLEGTPALVHGGPFANVAHGTSSLVATRLAMAGADVVVQEAGFAADLGAEKFLDIFCRELGRFPDLAIVVATRRALALHGEENLRAHLEFLRRCRLPALVALNEVDGDDAPALSLPHIRTRPYQLGGAGALELARAVLASSQEEAVCPVYPMAASLEEKLELLARDVYGAGSVEYAQGARAELEECTRLGFGDAYVCVAKTQASLSDDPRLTGRPHGFPLTVRSVRLMAGAGFVVPLCGAIETMPGLGRSPNLERIDLSLGGQVILHGASDRKAVD
jgi:formate--tetrahydrofolate ligase